MITDKLKIPNPNGTRYDWRTTLESCETVLRVAYYYQEEGWCDGTLLEFNPLIKAKDKNNSLIKFDADEGDTQQCKLDAGI